MNALEFTIDPAWRSSAVLGVCHSVRQVQDFGLLPVLADALEDAGCAHAALLTYLRAGPRGYVADATLVARVMGGEPAAAVEWLVAFTAWRERPDEKYDCPDYLTLMNAATGRHAENYGDDEPLDNTFRGIEGYYNSDNNGTALYFGGHDAHGEIPPEFWDKVALVTGVPVPPDGRAGHFSCSC